MYYHLIEKTGGVLILIQSQQRRVLVGVSTAMILFQLTVVGSVAGKKKKKKINRAMSPL